MPQVVTQWERPQNGWKSPQADILDWESDINLILSQTGLCFVQLRLLWPKWLCLTKSVSLQIFKFQAVIVLRGLHMTAPRNVGAVFLLSWIRFFPFIPHLDLSLWGEDELEPFWEKGGVGRGLVRFPDWLKVGWGTWLCVVTVVKLWHQKIEYLPLYPSRDDTAVWKSVS